MCVVVGGGGGGGGGAIQVYISVKEFQKDEPRDCDLKCLGRKDILRPIKYLDKMTLQ